MVRSNLYQATEAKNVIAQKGMFTVIEYVRDISVAPHMAQEAYFASEMNVRKRQLIAELNGQTGVVLQSGMMQMMLGQIEASTGVRSVGDFFKNVVKSVVTEETIIKPHFIGEGTLVLEPTYKHIILFDMSEWNGEAVIEDGMFLACEDSIDIEVTARKNASSLILGGEGIFNTLLSGKGMVAVESMVPEDELFIMDIRDDIVRIDGNMAVAWSSSLDFTVEKTTSTLIGSFASGEGFVNVYKGTGKVLMAPVRRNKGISIPKDKR